MTDIVNVCWQERFMLETRFKTSTAVLSMVRHSTHCRLCWFVCLLLHFTLCICSNWSVYLRCAWRWITRRNGNRSGRKFGVDVLVFFNRGSAEPKGSASGVLRVPRDRRCSVKKIKLHPTFVATRCIFQALSRSKMYLWSWLRWGSLLPAGSLAGPKELPRCRPWPRISTFRASGVPPKKTWVPWAINIAAKGSASLKRLKNAEMCSS